MAIVAIAMSLYHMYVAAFGPPEALIFRGTHLLFALTLVFLLYPLKPGGGIGWRIADGLLLAASCGFILHIFSTTSTSPTASSTSTSSRAWTSCTPGSRSSS